MAASNADKSEVVAESPPPGALTWLRKRSGEVTRFDSNKLARSIHRAARCIGFDLTVPAAMELAHMGQYFVEKQRSRDIPASDEVADWIEKSLRETGHEAIAASYHRHRQRREWARQSVVVAREDDRATETPVTWDKSLLRRSLNDELGLDGDTASEVAGAVERAVLGSGLTRITTDVIRELLNNELAGRGRTERMAAHRRVELSVGDLHRALQSAADPEALGRAVAGRVWEEFMRRDVWSPEIAHALHRGLLQPHPRGAPRLAGAAIDLAALVRRAQGVRDAIRRLGQQLAGLVTFSSGVAIDGPDALLALLAGCDESAELVAAELWQEVVSRLRHSGCHGVLNLYGSIPESARAAVGAGPLFQAAARPEQAAFAAEAATQLLGLMRRDAADLPHLRIDWHWQPGATEPAATVARRALRMALEGHSVAMACSRGGHLADGLVGGSRPPLALAFLTVHLPTLWREHGAVRSTTHLLDALAHAVPTVVRAALQKREFLRHHVGGLSAEQIDRAALVVGPGGLDWTVRQILGHGIAEDESALSFACHLVRRLRECLEREARPFALPTLVDAWTGESADLARALGGRDSPLPAGHLSERALLSAGDDRVVGLTPWAPAGGIRQQMHAAGRLHQAAGAGTLLVRLADSSSLTVEKLSSVLDWACAETGLVRVRWLVHRAATQASVAWPEG
jgi:hypothetical protein